LPAETVRIITDHSSCRRREKYASFQQLATPMGRTVSGTFHHHVFHDVVFGLA
jgi:hypothetical protein